MDVKIWLRTVLQHYAEPDRTFRDVDAVLQMYFTSLKPKVENYTYNDGRSEMLLCLYGTVPITYRSIPYNIPIAFYIPIEYPHEPPIPYVKPTVNMLVREGKHVDKSGLCYHPYRSSWTEDVNKHTLLELVAILQQVFSQEPPVYTKPDSGASPMLSHVSSMPGVDTPKHRTATSPPPPTPPPPPPPPPPPVTTCSTSTPSQTYSPSMKSETPRWAGDGTAYYNIHQGLASMTLSPTSYTPTPPPVPTATASTGHPVQKSAAIPTVTSSPVAAKSTIANPSSQPRRAERELQDKVYRKVAERMQAFNLAVSNEMDKLLAVNRQLNDGEARIAQEQYTLQDMARRLQNNIRILESRESDIDQVIQNVNAMPDIAVDEALCGTTVVYNQMFDLVADDNAIVDTIYYLGKALNSERIDLVTFMKCTRTLAREQFMKRALLKKIMESQ